MTAELKPCPFCAMPVLAPYTDHEDADNWYVACEKCGCSLFSEPTEQQAIDAWNKRR